MAVTAVAVQISPVGLCGLLKLLLLRYIATMVSTSTFLQGVAAKSMVGRGSFGTCVLLFFVWCFFSGVFLFSVAFSAGVLTVIFLPGVFCVVIAVGCFCVVLLPTANWCTSVATLMCGVV